MANTLHQLQRLVTYCAVVSLFVFVRIGTTDADAVSWNYKPGDHGGPENWYLTYPDCAGVMQSPININNTEVLYDPNLELIDFSEYKKTANVVMSLENVQGHTAEVIMSGEPLYIQAGGLPDRYKLEQFHFHWGSQDLKGSEHAFNGQYFPLEAHFVHRQYRLENMTVAAPHPFGLAVVALFFKIGKHNDKYDQLLNYFDKIKEAAMDDTKTVIPTFPVMDMLPVSSRHDYFRYYGSLTTPPCYESVIWSVLAELQEVSEDQLAKFRSLYDEEHHQLVNDFRPLQPIRERAILTTNLQYKTGKNDNDNPFDGAVISVANPVITLIFATMCLFIYLF